jgi:hypothetical protein
MPHPDFFARPGLFGVKDFFDADSCASLRAGAAACERETLAVVDGYSPDVRNEVRDVTYGQRCTVVSWYF